MCPSRNKADPPPEALERLKSEKNVWMASGRPDGRPHLVPVWFAWHTGKIYFCVAPNSVKARNLTRNPHLALALENGSTPVICEGLAAFHTGPPPEPVRTVFHEKYDWDISSEKEYTLLVEVTPQKWLTW